MENILIPPTPLEGTFNFLSLSQYHGSSNTAQTVDGATGETQYSITVYKFKTHRVVYPLHSSIFTLSCQRALALAG